MNIETERLIIKPLTLDDAKRFSEYRDKEEVAMYQSWDEIGRASCRERV